MENEILTFTYCYKKPGGCKLKIYSVKAKTETEALKLIPKEIDGYLLYGFLGFK